MAIIDKLTEFCDNVSVAAAAGTTLKGNQIFLNSAAGFDQGNGQPVYLVIEFGTALDSSGGAATAQFKLVSDDTASISTTTSTVHLITPAFTETQAVQGFKYVTTLPTQGPSYEQYLGILCTIAGETATVGNVDVWLSMDPLGWKAYPDGAH